MFSRTLPALAFLLLVRACDGLRADIPAPVPTPPLGPVGQRAVYRRPGDSGVVANGITRFEFGLGPVESRVGDPCQWAVLQATKANGTSFKVWMLTRAPIPNDVREAGTKAVRYLTQEGTEPPREFVDRGNGMAVLPSLGGWESLWPRPHPGGFRDGVVAREVSLLGMRFTLESSSVGSVPPCPESPRRIVLRPDMWVGVPGNERTRDDRRRFDGSDYPMVRLTRADYAEMIDAGMNCFRVDPEQAVWLRDEPVYYWGVGGRDVPFPECLYRSNYLGPALFLDEPAVGTRDHDVRPLLAKDPALRRALTPGRMFEAFRDHFHRAVRDGAPTAFMKGMQARADVELGSLRLAQDNLYSWETMVATAAWQLTGEPTGGPRAIVFEPPGRLGTRRTVPEMNMAYGCQLPPSNPASLADPVFGFLRGAARAADKQWGVSIYGAVDPADAPFLLTHAYDLGATHFFFWDNYQLACVPYAECLRLARLLQAHAGQHPDRQLTSLLHAADTLILIPPGYELGHVQMGRGNLWGIPELNLERRNAHGVRHRDVMAKVFVEIERCVRLGLPFDLAWDLDGLPVAGYREIVRVRENGRIDVATSGRHAVRNAARIPERPPGTPPRIRVELNGASHRAPRAFLARAFVEEGTSPVYYTTGTDGRGVQHNARVLWELYGPLDEDYRTLLEPGADPRVTRAGNRLEIELPFAVDKPGSYRLRAATTDEQGRSAVAWTGFVVDR
ncbi:MAG: hypothetical protein DVB31_03360 [Verrucomicrobia bacterium]|nr:MAG: hypothetical protein DVB31_03360 [Verrucomicrobiota bacterium]